MAIYLMKTVEERWHLAKQASKEAPLSLVSTTLFVERERV